MDITQIKHVIEAALLAAGRPLPFDTIASLFAARSSEVDKETLQEALTALASDYQQRGLELKEVSSGFRIQVRKSMSEWLTPLWEERAPRYTRALLETLALVAYRQPITRAEIEEVRGVAVSTNIMRTLLERNWVRVVGHRDVPGKPAMFGTTREFLDYFGLKRLEDLPPLAEIKDALPELIPQNDLIDALQGDGEEQFAAEDRADEDAANGGEVHVIVANASLTEAEDPEQDTGGAAEEHETESPEVPPEYLAGSDDPNRDDVSDAVEDVPSAAEDSPSLAQDVRALVAAEESEETEDSGETDDDLLLSRSESS
ncbi:MAG: SMC-Scp complex subunit ScpB [Gammaproteobacteria bacterium]|nr:SMC-Scp complex subunit ScpB [Gammaproteobacteria bacterium]